MRRVFCGGLSLIFLLGQIILPGMSSAQLIPAVELLPPPGVMVTPTPAFAPALIKGLRLDPANALHFDFIIDQGASNFEGDALREEAQRLIKYFLASLTVPNDELWVNLSPHEKDRIIPESFGVTQMGRDLLAQDYILKQLTASLMYPEEELGKRFWKKVQKESFEKFGTSEIPVNSFNKVWIVPEKAVVYEQDNMAFVVESHLKVMLEEDYLAMQRAPRDEGPSSIVTNQIIREIIIPEIEREVNEGANFAQLRQIYHSMILAAWFKRNLHNNILNKIYANQNMVTGVDIEDKDAAQKIYEQYLEAFKKGVYDYIKEDYDPVSKDFVPRKYFSGGFEGPAIDRAMTIVSDDQYAYTLADQLSRSRLVNASIGLKPQGIDQAMSAWADEEYVSAHEKVVAVKDGRFDGVVKEVLSYVRSRQPSDDLRIADFGAGPGAVVEGAKKAVLEEIPGSKFHITVFEKDDLMLKALRGRDAIDEVVEADLVHDDLSGYEQKFDIILLMQVLHEVFSATSILYNQPLNIEESKVQVKSVIERVMKTLKPGGLILISDPLEPPGDPDQWIKIRFRSESALKEFRVFQQGYVPIPIDALATSDNLTFEMPLRHFWSYAILVGRPNEDGSGRYIDDPRRWEIERHERHAYFSQEEYREILMQNGASVTVETKPATEAFKKRLEERVEILTEGVTLPYDYNLIVGTKSLVDQAQAPQDYPFRDWGLRNGPLSTGQGLYKKYLTNELTASGLEFHEADLLSSALVRANDGVFEYLVEIGYLDRGSVIKLQAKTEDLSLEGLVAKLKEDKTKYEQNTELSDEQRKRALVYLYARVFTYKRYEDFRQNFSKTLTLRAAEKNFHPRWWAAIGSNAYDRLKDVLGESNAKQWIIGHPWDPYQSWLDLLKRLGGNYQKLEIELGDYLSKQWIVGHPRHPYRDWRRVKARLAGDYKRLKDELGESIAKYWIVGHPRKPYQAWQDVISGMGEDYQKLVEELKEFKAKEWIAHHPRDPYGSWTALLAKLGDDYQKLKDELGEYNAKQWVVGHPQDPYGAFLKSRTVGEEVVDAAMLASLLGNAGWMRILRSGLLMSALTLGSSSELLGQSSTIQNNFVGNHRFLVELQANTDIDIRGAVNELTASLNVALRDDQILKLIGTIYEHNPHLAGQSAVKAGQSLDLRPVYNRMLRLHFENVSDVVATNDNVIYLANIKDKRLAILSGMSVAGEEIYINLDASLKTIAVRLKQFERSAPSDWIRRGFVGNLLKNKNYAELIRYYIGTDQDHELIHRQNKATLPELFDRVAFRELIKGIDLLEGYDEELLMDDLSAYLGSITLNRDPKWPLFQTMIAEQSNDPADPVGRHYLNVDRIITHLFLQKSENDYKQFVLQYLYQQQAQKFGGRLYATDKSRIDSDTNLAFDRREYYKPEKQDYYVGYLLSLPEGTLRKQAQDILGKFYKGKITAFDTSRIPKEVIDFGLAKFIGSDPAMLISDDDMAQVQLSRRQGTSFNQIRMALERHLPEGSSSQMEYFDERIVPDLKIIFDEDSSFDPYGEQLRELLVAQAVDFDIFDWIVYRLAEIQLEDEPIEILDIRDFIEAIKAEKPENTFDIAHYGPSYYDDPLNKRLNRKWYSRTSRRITSVLETWMQTQDWNGKKVLEIAPGWDGALIEWFKERGAQVMVIDRDWRGVRLARQLHSVNAKRVDILELPQLNETYDLVVAASVLYYVLQDGSGGFSRDSTIKLLESLDHVIKDQGHFVASFVRTTLSDGSIVDHRVPLTVRFAFRHIGLRELPVNEGFNGEVLFFKRFAHMREHSISDLAMDAADPVLAAKLRQQLEKRGFSETNAFIVQDEIVKSIERILGLITEPGQRQDEAAQLIKMMMPVKEEEENFSGFGEAQRFIANNIVIMQPPEDDPNAETILRSRVSYELWRFYNDTTFLAGAFTALRQLEEGLYTIDSKTQGLFEAVGYLNLADIQGILVDYHMERKREALEAGEESKTNWEAAYDFDLGHLIFLASREDPKKAYKVLDYMSEGATLVDAVRAVEQGGDEAMAADATGAAAALNQAPFQVKSTATTTRQGRYDGLIDWLKYNPYLALEAETSAAVVDVGSSLGLTTIDLADAMGGLNPSLRVYGVDPGLHVGGARRQAPSVHAPIFIKDDHRLSQSPEIKEQIKVIVSANVFSHYNPSEQRTAVAQMADKLAEGGLLILGSGGQLAGHHLTFLVMQKIEGRLIPQELVLKESNIITDKRLDLWANYMPLAEAEIFQPLLYDLWIQMSQSIQEFKKRSVRESRETGKSAPLDENALLEAELLALQMNKVEFTKNGDGTVSIPLRQFENDKAMASKALPKEQWRPGDIVLLKDSKNEAKIIGINDMNWDGARRKVIRLDLTYSQGAYKESQGYVLFDEAEKELKYLRRESASTHRVSHRGVDRAMAGEAVRSEEFKVEFLYGYELPGTPTHFLKRDSVSGLSRETVGPDRQGGFSHFYLTKSRETRQLFNSLFNQQLSEEEFKSIVPLLVMFAEDGHESEPVPVAMAYYDDRRGFNEVTVVSLSTSQMINAWRFSLLFASKKSLLFHTILPSGVVSLEQKTFIINEENVTHFEMVDVLTDHYHEKYPRLAGYSDFEITYDAENPPEQDEAMTAPDDSELYAKTGQHYFPQADEIITIGEHRIQVVGMISSTHMGSTFKAKDLDAPGVPLRALKTRLIRLDQEPTFVFQGRGRLSEEAELLAAVADGSTQHHIGRALGYYPASAAAELNAEALLLEWLEGPLLSELIRRPSHESLATISLTERLELAAELADALEFIHQKGVVHRDIKLQNVKLVDGHLTLFDFGLAYREGDKNATGGSPGYAAPEQWNRGVDWDRSVDIFALSRLLAEWFVGEQHLLTETDKLLSGQMPEAPRKQLVSLLNRMRSYDPDKRPSAAFIAQELRRIDQAMTAPQALPEFSGKLSQSPQTGRLFYASQEPLVELLFDLWFVRHGETFGNSAGIYQGSTDWPINQLNDVGYRQAEWAALELYEKFAAKIEAGEEIVILASPLTRAKETADAFIRLVKERSGRTLKVHDEPGAIEINFGAMNSMTRSEAVATGWADVVQQIDKMRNASAKAEGGESFIDLLKRVRQWLEELNGRYAGKTVIVFGHGTFSSAIRVLLSDASLVEPEGHINWGGRYLLANAKPVLLSANHDAAMTALRFDQINYTKLDKHKPILVGANFDVVEGGKIKDPTKVIKGLEDLEHIDHPMVFVTHNGRPLTKGPQGLELDPIISLIQERMPHKKVRLASGLTGPTVAEEIRNLKSDEVLVLTNFRLDPRAESADEALRKQLVREIVYGDQNEPLFSLFISNAFASAPRFDGPSPSTSLIDFPELLPSVVGPLMARELEMLAPIRNITKHPFALMTGGSKIGDKIDATLNPLKKMQKGDILIIYGQMAFTYLQARAELRGETIDLGNSLIEWDYIGKAKEILTLAQEKGVRVILPSDHIETDNIKNPSPEKTKLTAGINISKGLVGGDIGIDTIEEIADALLGVRLVFNNGTAGVYQRPELAEGTKMIAKLLALAQAAGVEVIVGGGDAVDALKLAGVDGQIEKQSSGGGSSIQIAGLAEGEEWAPIVALNEAAQRTRQALAGALMDADLAMTQQLLGVEKKLAEVVRRLKANGNSFEDIEKVVGLLRSKTQLGQPIKEIILEVAGGDTRAAHAIAKNNPNIAVIITDSYAADSTYANAKQYRAGSLIAQMEPLPNLALAKMDIKDILESLPEDVVDHLLVVSPDIYVEPVFFDALKEEGVLRKFKSVMIKPYSSLSHIATSQPHRADFERIEGQGFLFNDRLLFKNQGQTVFGVDMIANSYQGRKDDDGIWVARIDLAMAGQSDRLDPDHDPKARSGSTVQYQLVKGYLRALNAVNDLKLKPNVIFYAPISPVRMLDPKFVNMLIGTDTVLAIRGEDVIVDINGVRAARYKSIFAAIDDFRNPSTDKAATAENVGGIDMNPDLLELETRGQGIEIQFDPAQLENLPITGFAPIIYSITPVMNLPLLLGIADDGESEPLAEAEASIQLSKAIQEKKVIRQSGHQVAGY